MQWEAVDGRNKGFLKKQEGIYSKFVVDMEIPGDSLDMSCSFHQAWDDFHLQGETLHSEVKR
jgi:hypothetical protein